MPTRLSFRVDLLNAKPPIWRSFELVGNPTFEDLHQAIQDACGWTDCHLYRFEEELHGEVVGLAKCPIEVDEKIESGATPVRVG